MSVLLLEETPYKLQAASEKMVFKIDCEAFTKPLTLYFDTDDNLWTMLDWCPIPDFLEESVRVDHFKDKVMKMGMVFTGFHVVSAHTFRVVLVAGLAKYESQNIVQTLPIFEYHPEGLLHGSPFTACEL